MVDFVTNKRKRGYGMTFAKRFTAIILTVLMIAAAAVTAVPAGAERNSSASPASVKIDLGRSEAISYFSSANHIVCFYNEHEGAIQLATTGADDPYVSLNVSGVSADEYKYVAVTYRCPVSNSGISGRTQFFFMAGGRVASLSNTMLFSFEKSYTYNTEIIDLSGASYWTGAVNAIRIDPFEIGTNAAWDTVYLNAVSFYKTRAAAEADAAELNRTADGVRASIDRFEERAASRTYDAETYTLPLWEGSITYHESALPLLNPDGTMSPINMVYDIDNIISVRNSAQNIEYKYGRDYSVSNGKLIINTTAQGGQIPCYPFSKVYTKTPPTSNYYYSPTTGYYVFCKDFEFFNKAQIVVTYTHHDSYDLYVPESRTATLDRAVSKLENNQPMNIVFCGDSVTFGHNSSSLMNYPPYAPKWSQMSVDALAKYYGNTHLNHINTAVGGTMSNWGYATVQENVIRYNPDLAVLAWGGNDAAQNFSAQVYYTYMRATVAAIRQSCPSCDIILVAPLVMNPEIEGAKIPLFASYLEVLWDIAFEFDHVAVVDFTSLHRSLLSVKRHIDITENNLNHINDFSSRMYAQSIVAALTGEQKSSGTPVTTVSADTVYASNGTTRIIKNGGNDPRGTYLGTVSDTGIYAYGWLASSKRIKSFGYRYGSKTVIGSQRQPTEQAVLNAGASVAGLAGSSSRFKVYIPVDPDEHEVYAVAELYDGTVIDMWKLTYDTPGEIAPVELKYKVSADQVFASNGATNLAKVGGNSTAGTSIDVSGTNSIFAYGWFACSYPIAKFGYRYGDNVVLNSSLYVTEAPVIAAGASYAGATGSTSRFRIAIPIDMNSTEVYAVAQLSDGTVIDMWKLTYTPRRPEEAKLLGCSFNTVIFDGSVLCDVGDAAGWLAQNPVSYAEGIHSVLTLRGWAICNKATTGFGYRIDGGSTVRGSFIEQRNDVKAVIGSTAEGFRVNADISALRAGTHKVEVVAVAGDGSEFIVASAPFTVTSSSVPVRVLNRSFDAIALDSTILCNNGMVESWTSSHPISFRKGEHSSITVRGWALLTTNITAYGYRIDGGKTVTGNFFDNRPDVKRIIGSRAEAYIETVSISSLAAGRHSLEVIALAPGGAQTAVGTVMFTVK